MQFILPLTHAHSTQESFNQVSLFFRNFPLASRHTGSASLTHLTKLFSAQVQFVWGSSNQTSPCFLSFFWLSKQGSTIGLKVRGGRIMEHATCCGPTQVQVESGLGFHTSPIWRIFPSESLQYGADMENKSKRVDQSNSYSIS